MNYLEAKVWRNLTTGDEFLLWVDGNTIHRQWRGEILAPVYAENWESVRKEWYLRCERVDADSAFQYLGRRPIGAITATNTQLVPDPPAKLTLKALKRRTSVE